MINNQLSIKLYQAIHDANTDRPMHQWHASSIAQCPKAQFMKRKNVPTLSKPTGAKIMRWQAGHNIEEALEQYVGKIYKDVSHNVRFNSEELDLTGEYDFYDADTKRIIECKSVHDMAFIERDGVVGLKEQVGVWAEGTRWAGKAKWAVKQTPYLHHEMQEYCYYLLMKEQDIEVKGVDYVYISLSGRITTYSTEIDPASDVANAVNGRLRLLNEAWKNNVAPRCMCNDTESPLFDSVYKWCDFRDGDACCVY